MCFILRIRLHRDRRRRGSTTRRGVPGAPAKVPASTREEDAETTGTRQEARHSTVVCTRPASEQSAVY